MRSYHISIPLLAAALVLAACRSTFVGHDFRQSCGFGVRTMEPCSADGMVLVQAIDDRRILIAIDKAGPEPSDGFVDDLFLYTGSEAHGFQARPAAFSGHVEYSQDALRVVGKDGRQTLVFLVPREGNALHADRAATDDRRFDRTIGLSHYAGWQRLPLDRLNALRVSAQCDAPAGACVEVDGFRIRFPS
jgi:hypothetical protein